MLTLLISTRDKELTIGFEAAPGLFGWHVHMRMYGAKSPDDELKVAVKIIEEIINDKIDIAYSSDLNHVVICDINDVLKYKDEDEAIKVVKWSEL